MKNKQLVITQFNDDICQAAEIIETDIPELREDEVLVKNKFLGINALYDRELYRGKVPYIKVQFPYVFGVEAVGNILQKGKKVAQVEIGDAVGTVKVGTAYQEFQILKSSEIVKIPKATSEYLTLNPTGVSAFLALEKVAELKENETIVVSAAAGGLGHIIVQLAAHKNCKVIAICGKEEKVELLESLNCCSRIINYRKESVNKVLEEICENQIDVGFDSVGRNIFDAFLENLAPLGRLVVSGLAAELSAGVFEKINGPRVYESIYWKGASVRCFMNHLYKTEHPRVRETLFSMYQKNELKVKVDSTSFLGIESIISASEYLLAGKSCGKVVVELK